MKTLLLNLWAWVLLHPGEIAEAIGMLAALIAAATIGNATQAGKPKSWPAKFVDALAARTRKGAINGPWSWPVIGRSIFDAAMDASAPAPDVTAPQRPSVMPPSSGEVQ